MKTRSTPRLRTARPGAPGAGASGAGAPGAGASRARSLTAAVTLAIGVAVALPGSATAGPTYPAPDSDPFYAAPADLGAYSAGDVLKTRNVNSGIFPGTTATQLEYRSTNSAGAPIAAVTTVLTPPGGGANRPLVSYQPFINSLGVQCAPSHTLFNGALPEASGLNALLARGWAVAIPDHLGPTSAYGAARLGGRLVLDGLRAAQRAPLGLNASPLALVGYSGGGMATEWAAALAPSYAPELNIVGAAAGGVPVDIGQIANDLGNTPNPQFGLGFAASMGLEREYPGRLNLSDTLNPAGSQLRNAIANSCTDDIIRAGAGSSYPAVTDPSFRESTSVRSVLAENSLIDYPGVPRTPIFQWHGSNDQLVNIDAVRATVAKYCAAGALIDFDVIAGGDHGTSIAAGLVPAWNYLGDRFAGIPAPRTC